MTWVFGFFAVNDARLPFQYLFCITNAFQGLVIFLLHNIRDPTVVAWWRKVFHLTAPKATTTGTPSSGGYITKKTDYSSHSTSVTDDSTAQKSDTLKFSAPPSEESKQSKGIFKTKNSSSTSPVVAKKYLQLEQSKLMHFSTESSESNCSSTSNATVTSDFWVPCHSFLFLRKRVLHYTIGSIRHAWLISGAVNEPSNQSGRYFSS